VKKWEKDGVMVQMVEHLPNYETMSSNSSTTGKNVGEEEKG
jgi:hypothetical protein